MDHESRLVKLEKAFVDLDGVVKGMQELIVPKVKVREEIEIVPKSMMQETEAKPIIGAQVLKTMPAKKPMPLRRELWLAKLDEAIARSKDAGRLVGSDM